MFCAGCGKLHSGKMCKNVQKSSGVFFARFSVFAHVGKVRSGILSCWGVCAVSPGGPGGRGGRFWRKWPKMAKNGQNGPRGPWGVKNGQKWAFWHGSRIFLKGAWMSSRTFPPDYTLIRIAARGVCTGNSHRFPACAGVGFPTGFPAPGPRVVQTCAHSCNTRTLRARAATPRTPSKTRRQGHGFLHAHVSAKLPRTVSPTVHQQLLHRVEQMHQPERRRAATACF